MAQSASNYIFDRAQFASRIILPEGNLCLFGNLNFALHNPCSIICYILMQIFAPKNFKLVEDGSGDLRRKQLRTHPLPPF